MKKVIYYECDICGARERIEDAIKACEARGLPFIPPVGLIFGNASELDGRDKKPIGITFAIAKIYQQGHGVDAAMWACRNNGAGDSLGKELCGSGNGLNLYGVPDLHHPTFKRMVTFLTKENIPITIWDGKEAVPIETYRIRRRRISTLKKMGVEA